MNNATSSASNRLPASTGGGSGTSDTGASGKVSEALENVSVASRRARTEALKLGDQRKTDLLKPVNTFAIETERIAEDLRSRGKKMPAQLLASASHEVQDMTSYVASTPVEQIIEDISQRAQRRPLVFLGTAFVLGFATTRLLKADKSSVSTSSSMGNRTGMSTSNSSIIR